MDEVKHMAGIVKNEEPPREPRPPEEDDNYDPHAHRVIAKPTSNLDTMMHMLKGSIGAGILAMPEAFKRTGIIVGTVLLVIIGIFATWTIQILIDAQYRLCKRHRRGYMAYPKSMKFALQDGPPSTKWAAGFSYYFVDVVMIIWQLGICVVYFVFVASNVRDVLHYYNFKIDLRLLLLIILVPMILLNLVKDLKLMSPISSIANVMTIIGLLLVAFYMIEDDIKMDPSMAQCKNIVEIPIFVGTALFALEAVGVVLALEYNMEHPKKFTGLFGLFNIGMFLIVGLYLIVGIFGYLKYGDKIQASITLSLPAEQKKAQLARLIFAFAIFLSFPLQNFVAYNILWNKLKKKIPENRVKETKMADYAMRVALVFLPWCLAVGVPQLGPFISLFGAFCLSLLAIVFPALMDLAVCYKESTKYGVGQHKLIRDIIIIVIGILALLSGCYTMCTNMNLIDQIMANDIPQLGSWQLLMEEMSTFGPTKPHISRTKGGRPHSSPVRIPTGTQQCQRIIHKTTPTARARSQQVMASSECSLKDPSFIGASEKILLQRPPASAGMAYYADHPPIMPMHIVVVKQNTEPNQIIPVSIAVTTSTNLCVSNNPDVATSTDLKRSSSSGEHLVRRMLCDLMTNLPLRLVSSPVSQSQTRTSSPDIYPDNYTTDSMRVRSSRNRLRSPPTPIPPTLQHMSPPHRVRNCCIGSSPPRAAAASHRLNYAAFDQISDTTHTVSEKGEGTKQEDWVGGVRALRDSHVRLVLRQLRHIERLNRALDRFTKASGKR